MSVASVMLGPIVEIVEEIYGRAYVDQVMARIANPVREELDSLLRAFHRVLCDACELGAGDEHLELTEPGEVPCGPAIIGPVTLAPLEVDNVRTFTNEPEPEPRRYTVRPIYGKTESTFTFGNGSTISVKGSASALRGRPRRRR